MGYIKWYAFFSFLFLISCSISDGDRCPDDHVYDSERMLCVYTDTSSDDSDETETDTVVPEVDAGDSDTQTEDIEGFGELCNADNPCIKTASYCMAQPGQDGYCTTVDCQPSACPTGYQCCDCTSFFGMPVLCVADGDVELFADERCENCL